MDLAERYTIWNKLLKSRTETFAASVQHATVFLFSSYELTDHILENPEEYGFEEEDTTTEDGPIWQDELHFTSDVHAIIAEHLQKAFNTL